MRFKARYIPITTPITTELGITTSLPDYWRTIDADTLEEANRVAVLYTHKNYRLASLIQEDF